MEKPIAHRSPVWQQVAYGILAVSLVIRLFWYPVVVSDYTYFVRVWFDQLSDAPGLTAFLHPFADYAPTYLYLLKVLTVFPISSLYSEKTLSFLFDVLCAYLGYLILKTTSAWSTRKDVLFLAGVTLLSLPTVMVNSSLWGQSDSLYAAGVLGSLYFILIDIPVLAAVSFGLALCFKVQTIFFVPILIGYLLRRRVTWKYLVIPPIVFFISVIPAWFGGGSLKYWLLIYLTQSKEYNYLSVSAQSIFAFLQPLSLSPSITNISFWLGIGATAGIAAVFANMVKNIPRLTTRFLITVSLASVLIIPYVLPRMHERYFYLADLFATLYAYYRPRRFYIPLLVVGTSLASYMPFLSGQVSFLSWAHVDLRIPAAILFITLIIILYDLWCVWRDRNQDIQLHT